MSENMNFAEEFPGVAENEVFATPDTEMPEKAVASKETYTLADGSQGSRAAFIREKFLQDNMSRKEIADTYGFAYRVVYSATVNMTNEAEAAGRGRSTVNAVINVTEDGKYVAEDAEGNILVDGEVFAGELADLGELVKVDRNEWIMSKVDRNEWIMSKVKDGVSRGDIAKILDMSYGVIYNITKDLEGTREKHEVELEDGTVISRSEYIRQLFAAGKSRGEIAKELNVAYPVVWQATKVVKTEAEKYNDVVESLRPYADKVVDVDAFNALLDQLAAIEFKAEEAETVAE